MATACADPQEVGGFESTFVTPLDKDLECPICLMALREPLQTSCGHLMCRLCLDRITENGSFRCPLDNKTSLRSEAFADKAHERKILSLTVKCDHYSQGCTWKGELRHLQDHVGDDGNCPFVVLSCEFASVGCTKKVKRKDLKEHMESCFQQHTLLLLRKVVKLEKENRELKAQHTDRTASTQLTPKLCKFTWKIDNWTEKLRDSKSGGKCKFHSSPFYTGYHGYKLCIEARPDDKKRGYLGLYVRLMRGDYDYALTWPFSSEFTVSLLDQQPAGKDVQVSLAPKSAQADTVSRCFGRPTGEKNEGVGWDTFISHQDLVARSYIVNDRLLVEIQIFLT